jgi:hypothetical protein
VTSSNIQKTEGDGIDIKLIEPKPEKEALGMIQHDKDSEY